MNWYKIAQQGLMFYPWKDSPRSTTEKIRPFIDSVTNQPYYTCSLCKKNISEDEIGSWYIDKEGAGQKYKLPEIDTNIIIQGFTEIANYLRPFYEQYKQFVISKKSEEEGYGGTWGRSWEVQTPGLKPILSKYPIISELFDFYGTHFGWYLQKIMNGAEEFDGYELDSVSEVITDPAGMANRFIESTKEPFEILNELPMCEECYEGLETCTSCSNPFSPGEEKYPAVWSDTEFYCNDCVDGGRADMCIECGKADAPEDMHYSENGYLCSECYKETSGKHIEWASDAISNLDIPIGKNYPVSEKSINNVENFIERYLNKYGDKISTKNEWEKILYIAKKSRMSEASLSYLNGLKNTKGKTSTIMDIFQDIQNDIKAQSYIKDRYPNIKNFHDLPFDIEVVENYNNEISGFTVAITPSDDFLERAEKEKPGIGSVWRRMSHTPHHPGYLAYARCAYEGGDNIVINNLQRDADYDNYKARSISGGTGRDEEARWLDNKTKNWDVFLLDLLKSLGISENINVFLTTFDQQKKKWGNLPIHKSKRTYEQVPEQMGMELEDPDDAYNLVEDGVRGEMYQVANWYGKLKIALKG